MRSIKRILKIHEIDGYKVSCLFSNGESRIIDFKKLFQAWELKAGDIAYPLLASEKEFQQIALVDGTFVWKNIPINSTDEDGNPTVYFFDLDPIVLYENSQEDPTRTIKLGLMIKQARLNLGLTQEELAARSGTSKHYISKIENDKSGIELFSLQKIVEGGLGKRLNISFD